MKEEFTAGNTTLRECENGENGNGNIRWNPPNRRESETLSLKWPTQVWSAPTYFVTTSKRRDGKVFELFISTRPANPMADVVRDASIVISRALQHGVSISALRESITRLQDNNAASIIGAALDLISPNPGASPSDPIFPHLNPSAFVSQ